MSSREHLVERLEEIQTQLEELNAYFSVNRKKIDAWVDAEPMADLAKELLEEVSEARQYVEDIEEEDNENWTAPGYL